MACFWVAKQNPPTTLTVEFEWKSGLSAKDWSRVAKRGQIEVSFTFPIFYIMYRQFLRTYTIFNMHFFSH